MAVVGGFEIETLVSEPDALATRQPQIAILLALPRGQVVLIQNKLICFSSEGFFSCSSIIITSTQYK